MGVVAANEYFPNMFIVAEIIFKFISVLYFRCNQLWWLHAIYKSSSGDEIPERDMSYHLIWLLIYHWTTTHLYFRNIFKVTRTYYISNGRWLTKSAFRVLLLSTFRVSSINYSLVCSLPIHTRTSANAEGPRERTVSWNRVKCCTSVRRIASEKAYKLWITCKGQ